MSRTSYDSTSQLKSTLPHKEATSPTQGGFWNNLKTALSPPSAEERSTSRGRDLASTGRGGAGNIVRDESNSRTRAELGGDERGRDIVPVDVNRITHAGRGGQGNVRSPSRDAAKEAADRAYEEDILRKSREHREQFGVSYGRGGTGNIERSRSRSREPGLASGRGGLGNILGHHEHPHTGAELEKLEEEERAAAEGRHPHGTVSHGRGGQGNLSTLEANESVGTAPVNVTSGLGGRGGPGNVF